MLMLFRILLLILFAQQISCQNWVMSYLLPDDYDGYYPPEMDNADGRLNVNASIYVNSFESSDGQLNLDTDMYLCLRWRDNRIQELELNGIIVPGENETVNRHFRHVRLTKFDQLYLPMVYFRNAVRSSDIHILRQFRFVEVWPETKILNYCTRLNVAFICMFIQSNLPFDEQYCFFEIESMGRWSQNLTVNMASIRMPAGNTQFRVRSHIRGVCEPQAIDPFQNMYSDLPYNLTWQSCAYARVNLVRHVNYYIIRYFAPTFLLVCMSFLQAWVPCNGWPARIILTCIVELTCKSVSITAYNESESRHVTSLYWWLWVCQFFIYMGLIEFAMALAWGHFVVDKKIAHKNNTESPDGHYFGKRGWYKACGVVIERWLHKIFGPIDFFADPVNRNKVDYCARIIFPSFWFFHFFIYIIATFPNWGEKYRLY